MPPVHSGKSSNRRSEGAPISAIQQFRNRLFRHCRIEPTCNRLMCRLRQCHRQPDCLGLPKGPMRDQCVTQLHDQRKKLRHVLRSRTCRKGHPALRCNPVECLAGSFKCLAGRQGNPRRRDARYSTYPDADPGIRHALRPKRGPQKHCNPQRLPRICNQDLPGIPAEKIGPGSNQPVAPRLYFSDRIKDTSPHLFQILMAQLRGFNDIAGQNGMERVFPHGHEIDPESIHERTKPCAATAK